MKPESARRNGEAAAALVAAGIGTMVLGLLTTLAAASRGMQGLLSFYAPAGLLSGKSTIAVVVWIVAWVVLHAAWYDQHLHVRTIAWITLALVGLGLAGTFPPIFETFE
jgi:hypothetical protein